MDWAKNLWQNHGLGQELRTKGLGQEQRTKLRTGPRISDKIKDGQEQNKQKQELTYSLSATPVSRHKLHAPWAQSSMGASQAREGAEVLKHIMQGGHDAEGEGQGSVASVIVQVLEHNQDFSVVWNEPQVQHVMSILGQQATRTLLQLPRIQHKKYSSWPRTTTFDHLHLPGSTLAVESALSCCSSYGCLKSSGI